MLDHSRKDVTDLLRAWGAGDAEASEAVAPLVYDELRRQAGLALRRESEGHTLETTGLVHEAWLRLDAQHDMHWESRSQFFAVAAQLMRRIMVDHARQRHALKRSGGAIRVTLDECAAVTQTRAAELLALDEALEKLAAFDQRKANVVEMRYFGGLTMGEIADVLKIHVNTVTRDWTAARAWLFAALSGEDMDAP